MNKIKILSDNLANQIAAGEVVERPASVIKELLENALDAGASRLQIDTELGGRRLMRVSDDGEGMSRDDAVLAFERHATSKIKTLEDLGAIQTLGFRGEALASIASVAKVEVVTKTEADAAATRVSIEGGRMFDVKDAARPRGTTITVRDLFFNTPARRKFMRSEATENYHLTNIVTHYALAHPEISFTLTANGREILRVAPARDLRERAFQLFGANLIDSLLPIAGGREFIAKIEGFISAPRERRTTRDAQYFFINGRFVRDKIIAGGLLEGFRSVLPHGVYPVAFLFLKIPHEEIDVNVHPAKTEVRFRRSEAVKGVIAEAVRNALAKAGIVSDEMTETVSQESRLEANKFSNSGNLSPAQEPENIFQPRIEFSAESETDNLPTMQSFDFKKENSAAPVTENESDAFTIAEFSSDFENLAQTKIEENLSPKIENTPFEDDFPNAKYVDAVKVENQSRLTNDDVLPPVNSAEKIPRAIEPDALSASKIKPVAQLHESFIIAVDDEGMLLIDQHVAHERILFDKFRQRETDRKIESQNLLLPETFDLTPAQSVAFDALEPELESLGFAVMRLSGRTVAIKAVPTDLPPSEVRNLLAEILETVDRDKRGHAKSTWRDEIAASLACKAAVKINMKLTTEKMQWLIDRLLLTSSPTTCPHGRPVILRLTMRDIERGFHRP